MLGVSMAESTAKLSFEVESLSSSSETSEDEYIGRDLSSKPTLRELHQLPVTKWYNLGLQLEVDQGELEKIHSKHPQDDRICQSKMFGVWLREVETPNYEKLLKALVAIGRRDIAESVCEKEGFTLDSITRSSPSHLPSLHTSGIPAQLVKRPVTEGVERQPVDVSQKQIVPPERQTTPSFEPQLVGIIRLKESDVPKLMTILSKYAYKWEDIGIALGFTVPELRGISSRQTLILNSPNSFLLEMLNGWVNWPNEAHSSFATVEALETALQSQLVGLGVVSEQLRKDLQQTTTTDNQPSQIRAPPRPPKIPEYIERYARYLKSRYHKMPLLPQGEWPPTLGSQYSEITMVERDRTLPDQESVKESLEASFCGKVDELAKNEKVIKSLDELFTSQARDTDSLSLKVLVEGVPGAGKTTLVQKTCKDWANGKSLQQFNLVVLVALRMKEFERAESVSTEELLPADDRDLKQEVIRNITESSGELVLFIFDGFDELNETLRPSSSIFQKIIQGELLHNCAAILTSRPYASVDLRTDDRIHRHVEILGFTEKQIESYVMHNISKKSTARSLVKSLTEQIAITSFSYTPLSCSILLYIFKQEKGKLPSTLTELFGAFISSIVKRHAKKLKLITKTQEKKLDLNNLPEQLNHQFSALCKLAYDSSVKGKFMFSPQDIEDMYLGGTNQLSLMTSATSFSIQGEETRYQFLHMTIQEFLAARWIATQSVYDQKRFLLDNWVNPKIKLTLIFYAGITKLKGRLFNDLFINVYQSDLVHLVLKGLWESPYATFQCDNHKPHLFQKSDCTTSDSIVGIETDPFVIEHGITSPMPVEESFEFEMVAVSLSHPSVSRDINPNRNADAAQAFLCLASMIDETKDPSLVRSIFKSLQIEGLYLDFCRLTPMDCLAVANFLSKCPHHLSTLHFNFCSLTSVSLEIFHRMSTTTGNCWNECTEVEMSYNAPSFSASLSLLPQIKWFQHTKVLCLRGLQYPKGLPPEAFQLHGLLSLKALSDLTVTVERIPNKHLKNHEAVVMNFFKALKDNNTLLTLTYDQSPPSTNCELFLQLMSALLNSKLSLKLGHKQVITDSAVILPSKTCFKICSNGLVSAMKLADARSITIVEVHCQDLFLLNCSCQKSSESTIELRLITFCDQCDNTAPAVIYCSNCSANLCESCSNAIHRIKMFKNHKLIPVQTRLADSLRSSSLTVLNISECTLTNEVAKHIGAGLAENNSLKQLNIKTLDGAEALHIFRALEHNSSVQKLKISLAEGIGSSETVVTALSQMLKINKSLLVLDLSGCSINDAVAQHIASGLAENKTLQALNINSDQLKSEGAGYILQSLQCNQTLRTLRMFDLHIQITRAPLTLSIVIGASSKQSLSLVSSLVHTSIEKPKMFTGTGVLDLSECGITDAMVEKIVGGLTENSSLNQLDLSRNEITSFGAANIFRSLEHNTSLCRLLLSCNSQLAVSDSELFGCRLQQMLAANKSLSVLDLSGCGVTDTIAQHIASGLAENKMLQALSIDSEHLTHEGVNCILQSLKKNEVMKILKQYGINLDILYNPFCLVISIEHDTHAALNIFKSLEQDTTVEGLVICKLPPTSNRVRDDEALGCAVEGMLTVNRTLRILKLQDCGLNDVIAGHMYIANGLAKNSSVKQLNLKGNRITSVAAAHIFRSLEHNSNLEELDLSSNQLLSHHQNDGGEALGRAVKGMLTVNHTLRALNLRDCNLNDVIAGHRFIANGLAKNSSVKQLNLKGNRITSVAAAHIFRSMARNSNLEELDLSSNQLFSHYQNYDSEALGCAVEEMLTVNHTLRALNLQGCYHNDEIAGHIANGLAKNSSVKQLNLKGNRITITGAAHIFRSLEHNSNLEELDLSSNQLFSHYQNYDSEALGCAVEGMLRVNRTLRILNMRDCNLDIVIAGHIATALQYNSLCTCYTYSSHIKPLPRSMPPVVPSSVPLPLPTSIPPVVPSSVPLPLPRNMPEVAPSRVLKPPSRSMPEAAPSRVLKPPSRSMPEAAPIRVLKSPSRSMPEAAPSRVLKPPSRSMPPVAPSSVLKPLPRKMPPVVPSSVPLPLPRRMPPVAPSRVPSPLPRTLSSMPPRNKPPITPRTLPPMPPRNKPPITPRTLPPMPPRSKPPITPRSKPPITPRSKLANYTQEQAATTC